MNEITMRLTTPDDAEMISQLMEEHWGGEPLVVRAENVSP